MKYTNLLVNGMFRYTIYSLIAMAVLFGILLYIVKRPVYKMVKCNHEVIEIDNSKDLKRIKAMEDEKE